MILTAHSIHMEISESWLSLCFRCKDHIDILICQCRWGYSRSAAVAAAVREYFFQSGMEIFSDEEYYPNLYVFRETLKALKRLSHSADASQKIGCVGDV